MNSGTTYGDVRVSTRDQNEARQIIALGEFGVPRDATFMDKQSGKDFNRPAYQTLLAGLCPGDADTSLAETEAWLPEGEWVDFSTGWRYPGGQRVKLHQALDGMPVFARPGAVLPMDGSDRPAKGCPLPETLEFRAFVGANGEGRALEDVGLRPGSAGYRAAETICRIRLDDGLAVTVEVSGDASLLPVGRRLALKLTEVRNTAPDRASCGDALRRFAAGTRAAPASAGEVAAR